MLVYLTIDDMMEAFRRTKNQQYAFKNPQFASTFVGALGEQGFYKWAESKGLCPKWSDVSNGYCVADVVIGNTGYDVKSKKTLMLESNWFTFNSEQIKRIRQHSKKIVYMGVNIQKTPDDFDTIKRIYSMGITVEILGISDVAANATVIPIEGVVL